MRKGTILSMSAVLALSALTPVVTVAAENNSVSENAKPGFYNVKTGEVVSLKSFAQLSKQQKKEVFTGQYSYFADGLGAAVKASAIVLMNNSQLEKAMLLQTDVETQFKVLLTADGKVIFLSVEEVSNALADAIANAKKELDKLTAEQKAILENAITKAESALNKANTTVEELQAALDKLKEAVNNANTEDAKITDAKNAVEKAVQTGNKEDIDRAQKLVDQLQDGPLKNELQGKLDNINSGSDDLVFKHTEETQKTAPLFLDPVVTSPANVQKTSGGILGLDIGILEAGLISASQISKINDSNRHSVEVENGTTLDLTASVAMHTILGGHAFKLFVAKENEDGNFATVADYKGSIGGALGITVPTEVDLGTLEEGTYEIILTIEEGLTVVQVIPFKLIKQTKKDFTQVSTEKSIVSGNALNGQNRGNDDNLLIPSIKVKGAIATQKVGINGLELEGKYGTLTIDRNGSYEYKPASIRDNAGQVEIFEFTMKDIESNKTTTGTLEITLEGTNG